MPDASKSIFWWEPRPVVSESPSMKARFEVSNEGWLSKSVDGNIPKTCGSGEGLLASMAGNWMKFARWNVC